MVDDLHDLSDGTAIFSEKTYYDDLKILSKKSIQYIQDVRDGKIKEEPRILTGIKEIDFTMVTGLEKGTLTLICADVGCYKCNCKDTVVPLANGDRKTVEELYKIQERGEHYE